MFVRHLGVPFALLLILLVPAGAFGRLQGKAHRVIQSSGLSKTQYAMMVVDLDRNEKLLDINSADQLIPASNMKLFVTAAALDMLKPDFVFRTELRLIKPHHWQEEPDWVVADPAFDPNNGPVLVIKGDGDPAFCDVQVMRQYDMSIEQLLQIWVQAVNNTGIQSIQRLVVDDRVFDRQLVHSSWPVDQLNMWYSAQVAGLNMNRNCLDIFVQPTRPGQSPLVSILPVADFLNPSNRAVTGGSDTFWVSRKLQTNELTYWGRVKSRRSTPYHVTIHDPPIFFTNLLADRLRKAGIEIQSIDKLHRDDVVPAGVALHAVQTTMSVVLNRCNKESQNLYAEALLKRLGRRFTGSPGSWKNGVAAVRTFLNRQIGSRSASVIIADGSGLSRLNRITARAMVNLLQKMHQNKLLGPEWRRSLSIGGVDGTLRNRFRHLAGSVFAKSGSIDGVNCLSGYLVLPGPPSVEGGIRFDGSSERTIAFSFLFNNIKPPVYVHKIKSLQEKLINLIIQDVQQSAKPVGVGG